MVVSRGLGESPCSFHFILKSAVFCIPHICHLYHLYIGGEKISHVENFQISIHGRCGESPHVEEFQIFHTTDVEKYEVLPNLEAIQISPNEMKFTLFFCCKICFVAIDAVFCKIHFVAIYALLHGEKLGQKLYRWRKITNMRYGISGLLVCEGRF